MIRKSLSEQELRKAAVMVRTSMLEALPDVEEGVFREEFCQKIEELKRIQKKQEKQRRVRKRMFAAVAAFFVTVTMLLTFHTEVRATVIAWVKEVWAGKTAYWFTGEAQNGLPEYVLTWVPEGVECIYDEATEDSHAAIYTNQSNPQLGFTLHYTKMQEGTAAIILYNEAEDGVIPVDIRDMKGELYISQNPEYTHCLVWFDEERQITFNMTSYLEPEVMLHIAEGVKPAK